SVSPENQPAQPVPWRARESRALAPGTTRSHAAEEGLRVPGAAMRLGGPHLARRWRRRAGSGGQRPVPPQSRGAAGAFARPADGTDLAHRGSGGGGALLYPGLFLPALLARRLRGLTDSVDGLQMVILCMDEILLGTT
ncbi:unnamed protein product, partial [Effrenium voratum]